MDGFKPQLPPKYGYVEVEDINGNRVYKKVESEDELQQAEYFIELDFRLSLIELGVN